ncbi:MAG: response regulator, partial [Gemmatimonadaceae bacterium]
MSGGRILLADDEPTFATSTAELLALEGFTVDTVSNGTDALERVRNDAYDLLITDLEMPGNSDLSLVRQIARESGGLPVIVITGYPSVRSAVACIELPVSAYLTKPPDFPVLLEKVRDSVGRFRSYQAMQRIEQRLAASRQEFSELASAREAAGAPHVGADVFLSLTLRNVMGSLTDLEEIGRALSGKPTQSHACTLL